MTSHSKIVASMVICVLLVRPSLNSLQSHAPSGKEILRSNAVRIAEVAARYDMMMRNLNHFSLVDYSHSHDSLRIAMEYDFVTSDSNFVRWTRIESRYETEKYGFEEFEVSVFSRSEPGHDYTYSIALGYDGGAYRLHGFPKSDFENLVRRVFKTIKNEDEARLIAKWYCGFQNISLAFHEKLPSAQLSKTIVQGLKPVRVTREGDSIVLIDYSTTFVAVPSSSNSDNKKFDVNVFIDKCSIRINKETCKIKETSERIRTIKLKNARPEEYEITYLF